MLRERSSASRTLRPLVVSVASPLVVCGRAKPIASKVTPVSRKENASQRGRGLARRKSFGRNRGAAKAVLPRLTSETQAIVDQRNDDKLKKSLAKLVDDVKIEMEKNDRHVLSVGTLKKLDELEKLTKKVRSRMKRF